ncbi:unnamed protein product [Lota lota]
MFFSDGTLSAVNYALVLGLTCLATFCDFTRGSPDVSGWWNYRLLNYIRRGIELQWPHSTCHSVIQCLGCLHHLRAAATTSSIAQLLRPAHSSFVKQKVKSKRRELFVLLMRCSFYCAERAGAPLLCNGKVAHSHQEPNSLLQCKPWPPSRPNSSKSRWFAEAWVVVGGGGRGWAVSVAPLHFLKRLLGWTNAPLVGTQTSTTKYHNTFAKQLTHTVSKVDSVVLLVVWVVPRGMLSCVCALVVVVCVVCVCVVCLPKKLLQEPGPGAPVDPLSPSAHDPNVVGDSAPPQGTVVRPSDTVPGGPPQGPDMHPLINSTSGSNMALISDLLAAYTFIADHPERGALFFVCGVCLGLFLTLFALVVQISCRTDCPPRRRPPTGSGGGGGGGGGSGKKKKKKRARLADSADSAADDDDDSSDSDSDWDTTSDLSARRRRRFERTLNTNVFTSAEELERAQRLEERERIIREIWMNGQPDVPGTRSLNRYY